jgi:hypothetical protein
MNLFIISISIKLLKTKLFFWLQTNKNAVLTEIKMLELLVSSLARKIY